MTLQSHRPEWLKRGAEWRRAYVVRRAHEMAKSGRYRDALDIERALSAKGYIEAPEWLDRSSIHDDLNRLCQAHFKKGGYA